MMTKRSSHMPTLTNIATTNSAAGLERTRLEPEHLRHDHVAEDQRPVHARVRAREAVRHHELLVRVAAVPGHEGLHHVAVGDDQAGREHDARHVVEVAHGDEVLEAVDPAERDGQRQHHREAGEDGAGDEVRREDRRVPARDDADGEVEADDRVHRDHQRRREAGEQQVRRLVAMPVPRRAAPAHGQHAVDDPSDACSASGRAASPGRGSGRRTRTAARRWRRSRPRTRPRSAGCGTAATCPSCSGTGSSQ